MNCSPPGGQGPAQGHQGSGLLAGAREDHPVQGARVLDQVGAGEEGAHGVAQKEIGQGGVFLSLQLPQAADVPDHQIPAAFGGEEAIRAVLHRLSVAQVVLAAHQEAVGGEKPGYLLVPAHVLRHPVDDLNDRPGRSVRAELLGVNGVPGPGGGVAEFLHFRHGADLLSLWCSEFHCTTSGRG